MPYTALARRYPRLPYFIALARLDKPIGISLLLWPTLCAVVIAANGRPSVAQLIIFSAGVVLMRSAGCVINDFADRNFDGQVTRTRERPLASGKIKPKEALAFFALLVGLSALLLPLLNLTTFYWSFGALGIAVAYPFMKRFTYLPQVVLGAAFSWGIPMAFTAQNQTPGLSCWLLYIANLVWTVAYDTEYAMCDRPDDLKAGIKSTAILFGQYDRLIIALLQGVFLGLLAALGQLLALGWAFYAAIAAMLAQFAWQGWLIRQREPAACLQAFRQNHWVGVVMMAGVVVGFWG